jgi:uncharacterized membrane protein HdeD (DUF308 family)
MSSAPHHATPGRETNAHLLAGVLALSCGILVALLPALRGAFRDKEAPTELGVLMSFLGILAFLFFLVRTSTSKRWDKRGLVILCACVGIMALIFVQENGGPTRVKPVSESYPLPAR